MSFPELNGLKALSVPLELTVSHHNDSRKTVNARDGRGLLVI